MKEDELIKRLEELEQRIDKMLEHTVIEPQERKLITSVDELTFRDDYDDWCNDNHFMLATLSKLKYIESQWNEGKEFDWENEDDKHCLFLWENEWIIELFVASAQIFNFHSKQHNHLFLTTFSKELEIIKPLFS